MTVNERIERAESGIKYINKILSDNTFELWEVKEYIAVRECYEDNLKEAKAMKKVIEEQHGEGFCD